MRPSCNPPFCSAALPCWRRRAALAHTGDVAGGFVGGLAHPVFGPDHVVAMVAVGLWGAFLGAPAICLLPVVFPLVMAVGGVLGILGVPLPGVEIGIAVSAVVLGLMVALAARPPLWIAAVLVGAFAIFHGHAHGAELPPGADALAYSAGFVIATGCCISPASRFGLLARWPAGRIAVRTAGGAIALVGRGVPGPAGMNAIQRVFWRRGLACWRRSRRWRIRRRSAFRGFFGGLLHPLFVPAHLMAVLALGLLIGQQAPQWGRAAPRDLHRGADRGPRRDDAPASCRAGSGEAVLLLALACGVLVALARPLPENGGLRACRRRPASPSALELAARGDLGARGQSDADRHRPSARTCCWW